MKIASILVMSVSALTLAACATGPAYQGAVGASLSQDAAVREAALAQLKSEAPQPIEGNSGKFMSPFTSDGVTAGWVTKAMQVKASGQVGSAVGEMAGQQLMQNIPFIGGFLGNSAGKALGRSVAMNSIGGEAFLKESSDLSFNSLEDMAAYMYAHHSAHPEYKAIVGATNGIYPDFQAVYLAKYPQP